MSVINTAISIAMAAFISGSASTMTEVTPEQAAADFFDGMKAGNTQVVETYMSNEYVNFVDSTLASGESTAKARDLVYQNLEYDIIETATKGDVAVAKVKISNTDFSDVLDSYEQDSYEYVMEHLYDDGIEDKEKLSEQCAQIYVEEIAEDAEGDKTVESEIFLPMRTNGYGGWQVILNNEIMSSMLGNLEVVDDE